MSVFTNTRYAFSVFVNYEYNCTHESITCKTCIFKMVRIWHAGNSGQWSGNWSAMPQNNWAAVTFSFATSVAPSRSQEQAPSFQNFAMMAEENRRPFQLIPGKTALLLCDLQVRITFVLIKSDFLSLDTLKSNKCGEVYIGYRQVCKRYTIS